MDILLLKRISQEFNAALANYELKSTEIVTPEDLMNTENIVTNSLGNNKLTRLFLNNFFPQNDQPKYLHFTTINVLHNIVRNESIWLTTVAKRFTEKEFKPFYAAHGMDGYEKRINSLGDPLEKELVNNAFYLSLTHPNLNKNNTEHLWTAFSQNNGVKLVFEVSNVNTHLRRVYYPSDKKQPAIPLLRDFIDITRRHNRYLIIEGVATMGFFYLPGILECEEEYRLLLKRDKAINCGLKLGISPSKHEYVELPLFKNPIVHIKLERVSVEMKNNDQVKNILNTKRSFSTVAIDNNISDL